MGLLGSDFARRHPQECAFGEFMQFERAPSDFYADVSIVFPHELPRRELHKDVSSKKCAEAASVERKWGKLVRGSFSSQRASPHTRSQSGLSSLQHICSDRRDHRHHHVLIGENLRVVLALSKGQCARYPLLRLLQSICAEILANNIVRGASSLDPERAQSS